MTFVIRQRARRHPERKGYFRWSVWVDGPPIEMHQIDEVHYFLHSTFPEPHRIRRDRSDGFKLKSAGWGEFNIVIEIHLKDKTVERHDHWLRLSQGIPAKGAGDPVTKGRAGRGARVFVTHSATDNDTADTAMKALRSMGYAVMSADQAEMGSPSADSFKGISEADIVLAILPKRQSHWMKRELARARDEKKPIVGIALGGRPTVDTDGLGQERVVKQADEIAPALLEIMDQMERGAR